MKHKKLYEYLQQELHRRHQPYDWSKNARLNQKIPSGDWRIWLILAGRGFGKTRTGAETIRAWAHSGQYKHICLLGHSLEDVRQVMIQGQSGLLAVSPVHEKLTYHPSRRRLIWPSGAMATAYSAVAYQQLRGPQFDAAWIDELAKFPDANAAWDQLMLCLRLGPRPRLIITTTPRPLPLLKELLQRPDVVVTRGSTYDNQNHLSPDFIASLKKNYEHTRLADQEIHGMMVDNETSALWQPHMILRVPLVPKLQRIVVAIDPAVTSKANSDETGIIVAGCDDKGQGYVLEDLSGRMSPSQWIEQAVKAYHRHRADRIIAEINNGGDMVRDLLHSLYPNIPYRGVQATRSKIARAEPIAALYEQGRVFHCGRFLALEEQMLGHSSHSSPDRMDAMVWALSELLLHFKPTPRVKSF